MFNSAMKVSIEAERRKKALANLPEFQRGTSTNFRLKSRMDGRQSSGSPSLGHHSPNRSRAGSRLDNSPALKNFSTAMANFDAAGVSSGNKVKSNTDYSQLLQSDEDSDDSDQLQKKIATLKSINDDAIVPHLY